MKDRRNRAVSIIGGADGPTSVFIAGRTGKKPLKARIKNYFYRRKRRRKEKKIFAGAHTLEEVVSYANDKYKVCEIAETERRYAEQKQGLKESLITMHRPELLENIGEIPRPEVYTEESIRQLQRQMQMRSEKIAGIPDHEMPMNFHIYEVKINEGCLEIEIDYIWGIFGVSYSGSRKAMKQLRKIAQDLYIYYGVTEEDIREKSPRYLSLLSALT